MKEIVLANLNLMQVLKKSHICLPLRYDKTEYNRLTKAIPELLILREKLMGHFGKIFAALCSFPRRSVNRVRNRGSENGRMEIARRESCLHNAGRVAVETVSEYRGARLPLH